MLCIPSCTHCFTIYIIIIIIGVEFDSDMVQHSQTALASLSDKHIIDSTNIRIIQGDFFDMNLSEYDVLFYFDKGCKEQGRLKNKIKVELAPNARWLYTWETEQFHELELEGKWFDGVHGGKQQPTISVYRNLQM